MTDIIETLAGKIDALNTKDRAFAASLMDTARRQIKRNGSPSDKVSYWLRKMAERAEAPDTRPTVSTPDMSKLFGLLRAAVERSGGKLKYPKLILHVGSDIVRVSLAGRGNYAGQLKVSCTTREGRYGHLWMGAIKDDGNWQLPRTIHDKEAPLFQQVASLLVSLAADPAGTAREQAEASKSNTDHIHGNCCFCGLPLEDDASTEAGYGPTCAKNYDLPHGRRSRRRAA